MLYSDDLKLFTGELSVAILDDISLLETYLGKKITSLEFDDANIVIPIKLSVSIPPMGTIGGIDIRKEEPILVKINIKGHPYVAPLVMSDRKDFPKKMLSHLYVSKDNEPSKLCLVRNNRNEWFANKRITDLITVANEWFFKAAINRLVDDGEEFDPVRLEGYVGFHIYSYNKMNEIVNQRISFVPNHPFTLLFSYVYKNEFQNGQGLTYRSISPVQFIQIGRTLEEIYKIDDKLDVFPLLSILVWREDNEVENDYFTPLPETYELLKVYFQSRGVDINQILQIYKNSGCHIKNGIPIVYAIKRPRKMVGYDGDYEFINFLVSGQNFKLNNLPEDAPVLVQSHIEPFGKDIAGKLSGEKRDTSALFIGAGSLGSKIIIHDARTGKINIGVVDQDELLQHNLSRHALFNSKIGLNKAEAIIGEIDSLYEGEVGKIFKSYPNRIHNLTEDTFSNYDWIVDSTASIDVLNWLSNKIFTKHINIGRVEIADGGQLGLLYVEGINRNPRIDDLVNLAYFEATKNTNLYLWRKRDSEREVTNLSVGLGCSSTTTITADDMISFHASIFSDVLYKVSNRELIDDKGLFFISINEAEGLPNIQSQSIIVNPFETYDCNEGSGWQVRMQAEITNRLLDLCNEKDPIETGGVLIGIANYKCKTIHVFDLIEEPQDSKGTCCGFVRGVKGLPAQVDWYKEKTGNVIGYVGEWHTHPMDLQTLSGRDRETIDQLIPINNNTPIPTCAIIVTKEKILPFIFE